MTLFYIVTLTQYLNLTTTLLTINKQQIRNLLREKSWLIVNSISVPYSKVLPTKEMYCLHYMIINECRGRQQPDDCFYTLLHDLILV